MKHTFTISELAREFAVTPRAIRFYEDEGLIAPAREGLMRRFSGRDRARLSLILRGKRVGFSLAEIKEMLDLYDLEDGQVTQLRHSRKKFEERAVGLERQRKDLEDALAELQRGINWIDERLKSAEVAEKREKAMEVVGYGVMPRQSRA